MTSRGALTSLKHLVSYTTHWLLLLNSSTGEKSLSIYRFYFWRYLKKHFVFAEFSENIWKNSNVKGFWHRENVSRGPVFLCGIYLMIVYSEWPAEELWHHLNSLCLIRHIDFYCSIHPLVKTACRFIVLMFCGNPETFRGQNKNILCDGLANSSQKWHKRKKLTESIVTARVRRTTGR